MDENENRIECGDCDCPMCQLMREEEPQEDGLSDEEADRMTLRDAGYGTNEDYGYYDSDPFGDDHLL